MVKTQYQNELYHHGVKGQKWGIRRYQNDTRILMVPLLRPVKIDIDK